MLLPGINTLAQMANVTIFKNNKVDFEQTGNNTLKLQEHRVEGRRLKTSVLSEQASYLGSLWKNGPGKNLILQK